MRPCAAVLILACAGCSSRTADITQTPNGFCAAPQDEHSVYGYPEDGTLLRRIGYTAGHDGDLRIPIWTSYRLTGEYVDGKEFIPRKHLKWTPDPDLPESERATDKDYRTSGYSRGHMAMQSDMRGRGERCERQAYYLSNAGPQRQGFNAGVWLDLENRCKQWARDYGEVWIICGPVVSEDPPRLQGKTVGRVAVPHMFWKIVVRRGAGGPTAMAFLMRHEPFDKKRTPLRSFRVSIDAIEEITGLDFMRELDDATEDAIESTVQEMWP